MFPDRGSGVRRGQESGSTWSRVTDLEKRGLGGVQL